MKIRSSGREAFCQYPLPSEFLDRLLLKEMLIFLTSSQAAAVGRGEKDALFQDLIRQSTTAFWDAYLKDDAEARAWLVDGGFASILGADGRFEKKGRP